MGLRFGLANRNLESFLLELIDMLCLSVFERHASSVVVRYLTAVDLVLF